MADINYLGERDYSIRAWLDPEQLASRNITAARSRERHPGSRTWQVVAGASRPAARRQRRRAAACRFDALGRLNTPEQFGDIIIKAVDGRPSRRSTPQIVRLGDVARVELAAQQLRPDLARSTACRRSAWRSINCPAPTRWTSAEAIRKPRWSELKKRFPDGLEYEIAYDTTPFISESIADVVQHAVRGVVLVAIVVLVFLQNWRAALIPLVAVPVAIVGTFAVMAVLGFSLNNIRCSAWCWPSASWSTTRSWWSKTSSAGWSRACSPKEAAQQAMDEVTGPVIAVALVLCAVFVPCAFITGITGPVLPAVRRDDRRLDGDLGVQLADAEPGAGGACCCKPQRRASAIC